MSNNDPRLDLAAAAMFMAIGAAAIWVAADYAPGTLRRLGPGALPLGLGALLIVAGAGLAVQAVLRARRDPEFQDQPLLVLPALPKWHVIRATTCVVLGLVLFGLMVRPAGLFLATAALVFLSSRADAGTPLLGSLILTLVIPTLCVAIFIWGIGLPIRVWP